MAIAKRFDALVHGRIKSQNLTSSIQSEQPANFSICDSSVCICEICGSSDESPNTEPHACESGTGNTINNQSRTPPGHSEVEECDLIDTLVTRSISVNDQHQQVAGEDFPMSKTEPPQLCCMLLLHPFTVR